MRYYKRLSQHGDRSRLSSIHICMYDVEKVMMMVMMMCFCGRRRTQNSMYIPQDLSSRRLTTSRVCKCVRPHAPAIELIAIHCVSVECTYRGLFFAPGGRPRSRLASTMPQLQIQLQFQLMLQSPVPSCSSWQEEQMTLFLEQGTCSPIPSYAFLPFLPPQL